MELIFVEQYLTEDTKLRLYKCDECNTNYMIPYFANSVWIWKHLFCHKCYPDRVWVKEKSSQCRECNKQETCVYVNLNGTYKPK